MKIFQSCYHKCSATFFGSQCIYVCMYAVGRITEHTGRLNINTSLEAGGTFSPQHCAARQRVAVVIPFRDRHTHLSTLLPVLHGLMQRQQLHYTVFVVEQVTFRPYLLT